MTTAPEPTTAEPADGALVAFGPPTEVRAVYQRCTAAAVIAGCRSDEHWFQCGDEMGDPLSWVDLLGSHVGDAGPHLLTLPDPPRVFAVPIPADVRAVTNRHGARLDRVTEPWDGVPTWEDYAGHWVGETDLVAEMGPLTEVVEPDGG
jgi:hypothetical protein